MTTAQAKAAIRQLDADWPRFITIVCDGELAHAAGRLAEAHGIRGADAVHLALSRSFSRAATTRSCVSPVPTTGSRGRHARSADQLHPIPSVVLVVPVRVRVDIESDTHLCEASSFLGGRRSSGRNAAVGSAFQPLR